MRISTQRAYSPPQTFRELVSCSNCTDYQSRRLEVRCGAPKKGPEGKKAYVHLLNRRVACHTPPLFALSPAPSLTPPSLCLARSTLTATERTLCCVLENHQTPEGLRVPDVLVPYMHGITFIPFVRKLVKGKLVDVSPAPEGWASSVK